MMPPPRQNKARTAQPVNGALAALGSPPYLARMDDTDTTITLTRAIDAPVDEVFRAFTDPAMLEQWLADHVDAQGFEGGSLRFEIEGDEDAGDTVVSGDYLAFVEDAHLRMNWRYEGAQDRADAVVDIRFRDLGDGRSDVTVAETSPDHAEAQSRIFSIEAWSAALEVLADLLE